MFGEYDGSTILVLPESSFSSSSIYIFSRPHNYTYSAAVIGQTTAAGTVPVNIRPPKQSMIWIDIDVNRSCNVEGRHVPDRVDMEAAAGPPVWTDFYYDLAVLAVERNVHLRHGSRR